MKRGFRARHRPAVGAGQVSIPLTRHCEVEKRRLRTFAQGDQEIARNGSVGDVRYRAEAPDTPCLRIVVVDDPSLQLIESCEIKVVACSNLRIHCCNLGRPMLIRATSNGRRLPAVGRPIDAHGLPEPPPPAIAAL